MRLVPRTRIVGVAAGLAAALVLAAVAPVPPADSGAAPYLIYLHGRIVQETQDPRPEHPKWGPYELQKILADFRAAGFVVRGTIRPRSASVSESADRVVAEVRELLASRVPAERIIVVGASMGASIALLASARLQNPALRFVVLGACLSASVRELRAEKGKGPSGRILSFRESTDDLTEPCTPWKERPSVGLPAVREIVLRTGLGHGFLYRPLPEWMTPALAWAGARD
jgi:pimeloyl-ACP methyl ester carboxylesterase